ncbi:MAG: hypothetical protein KY476_00145 [Planctomycetes bacterium]|nr:hypothetical protein [Planctomycetota bacterium]
MHVMTLYAMTVAAVLAATPRGTTHTANQMERVVSIFRLKHIEVTSAAVKLREQFGHVDGSSYSPDASSEAPAIVVADVATNTLIVCAVPKFAEMVSLQVSAVDMDEFWKRHPPCPFGCCLDPEIFPDRLNLTGSINAWLSTRADARQQDENHRIFEALEQPVSFEASRQPFRQIVSGLVEMVDINCVIDDRALNDAGLTPDTPMSFKVNGLRFGKALDQLLAPLNLTYDVEHEVLKITSDGELADAMMTRTYPVADLVASVKDGNPVVEFETITRQIKSVVLPGSWSPGGSASITPVAGRLSLAIRQTRKGHELIKQFLKRIRADRFQDETLR